MAEGSKSFQMQTNTGLHEITVATGEIYDAGKLRIQPPVSLSEQYLEFLGDDPEIYFSHQIVGAAASMITFQMAGDINEGYFAGKSAQERITYAAETLIRDLAQIESSEQFIHDNTFRS